MLNRIFNSLIKLSLANFFGFCEIIIVMVKMIKASL